MEVFGLGLKIKEEGAATVEASIKRLGLELAKTALTIGTITKGLQLFVRETAESQRVQAQLASALRSTNSVSGQTIESLNAQATALMQVTAFGDEAIGMAQALLLIFTNIRGEIFSRTVPAVLNLATRMEIDLSSAASMLGKALQDPANGLTALNRQMRLFTPEEEKFIDQLTQSGKLLEAQAVILERVEGRVGNAAEAYRNTLGGALAALGEAFGNLFEASDDAGTSMVTAINGLTNVLIKSQPIIQGILGVIVKAVVALGTTFTVIATGIARAMIGVGTIIINMLLTPLSLIPGIGDNIARFLDGLNDKVNANDLMFAEFQETLKGYRTEVLAGTIATKQLNDELDRGGGGGGAGAGGRRRATIEELGQRTAATAFTREQFGAGRERRGELIRGMIPQFGAIALTEAQTLAVELQTTFQQTIGNALVGGIVGGIEQAVASGNISDGFKALSSMLLAGIGDAMIQFGTSTAAFSQFMAKITAALMSLNPAAGLAASLALIGVGAALKGAARGMFGGQRGGGAGSISNFGGNLGGFASNIPTTQIIFGQTSATTAAGMQPRQAMNVTIIGPNDPQAQRAMQELMNKANSRGRIG